MISFIFFSYRCNNCILLKLVFIMWGWEFLDLWFVDMKNNSRYIVGGLIWDIVEFCF